MATLTVYKKYIMIMSAVWIACLLLFAAAYMVVLKPQADTKKHLAKKLAEKKQEHKAAQKAAEERTRTELNEQIARLREKLGDFVVDFEDAADLNFDITQIAREEDVASLSVGSGKSTKTAKTSVSDSNSIEENYIDISFVAGFNQFASIVNNLERHRPVIFVHEFNLSPANQNKEAYQVTLDVRALIRKPQEAKVARLSPTQHYGAEK